MIAIGGMGGSGTRAVAEIFGQAGLYMGDDLNGANDNLFFTRLFKDPCWYKSASENNIEERLEIFERYMGQGSITPSDFVKICRVATSNKVYRSDTRFYINLSRKVFRKRTAIQTWGWKEPNTQIYVNTLMKYFKQLKYIHVIRHGLDMAYSKNKQQLKNWGWKFNIHLSGKEDEKELAIKQVDYWIRSNQYVQEICSKYPGRYMLLHHEELCNDTVTTIDRILAFSGIKTDVHNRNNLYSIPKNTGSNKRYKDQDISIFSPEQIKQIISHGYSINS